MKLGFAALAVVMATLVGSALLLSAADGPNGAAASITAGISTKSNPLEQPPEPVLRNLTADEKMMAVREMLSWVSAGQLTSKTSATNEVECRGLVTALDAGKGIRFLDPDFLGATQEPAEVGAITGRCNNIQFYEWDRPPGRQRATRNFTFYNLAGSEAGLSLIYSERWCLPSDGQTGSCVGTPVVTAFERQTCRPLRQIPIAIRDGEYPYKGAALVHGVLEFGGNYYFAEIGSSCSWEQARKSGRYTIKLYSVGSQSDGQRARLVCTYFSKPAGSCDSQ